MLGLRLSVKAGEVLARKIEALRERQAGFSGEVSKVVRDSAYSVCGMAQDMVPRSTGALARSIEKPAAFLDGGFIAIIGSWLPYAARQEYDVTLDHSPRHNRIRVRNTKSGKPGSIIKGTGQFNPNAQWGFLRKALLAEKPNFLAKLQAIVSKFGDAWKNS